MRLVRACVCFSLKVTRSRLGLFQASQSLFKGCERAWHSVRGRDCSTVVYTIRSYTASLTSRTSRTRAITAGFAVLTYLAGGMHTPTLALVLTTPID
jgi:hypothetical protein